MSSNIRFPQGRLVDSSGMVSLEWQQWFQNPQVVSLELGGALAVDSGGTGLSGGTSGGVLAFTASDTLSSSGVLTASALVLGGGAGAVPSTPVGLGTTTTVLHGNAAGAPSWAKVSLTADVSNTLPVANGGTGIASGTSGGVLGFTAGTTIASSAVLTSSALVLGGGVGATPATPVGLGTTVTVLHGNAAGNPSWASVSLTADVSGQLPLANGGTNANLTASLGGIFYSTATAGAILSGTATAGQMLRSGASAAPTWSTATFPATAGTAANVLRSDGTNFLSAALAAADLSNGTTGSGAVMLAAGPTTTGTLTAATVNVTAGYSSNGTPGVATFGPSAVASITVKNGIVTAIS